MTFDTVVVFNILNVVTPNATEARVVLETGADVTIAAAAVFDVSGIAVVAFGVPTDIVRKIK